MRYYDNNTATRRTTMDIETFCTFQKITMVATAIQNNPMMEPSDYMTRHFRCVVQSKDRQCTFYFSQGSAHTVTPTVEDVLDCVAAISAGVDGVPFKTWCDDYGYDSDSYSATKKAKKIYNSCNVNHNKLVKLLGFDATNFLMYDVERM